MNDLPHLKPGEYDLFKILKHSNWRIEQEKLEMEWALAELAKVV